MTGQQEYRITDYEHCDRMSSDGEHQCNYRGGNCRFVHTKKCKDYIKCMCELCSNPVHEQQFPKPTDEQCRKDATGKVLEQLDEWLKEEWWLKDIMLLDEWDKKIAELRKVERK